MPVHSNRAAVEARMALAEEAGLRAAAAHYANAMKQALLGGYTSGNYAHGFDGVAGSPAWSEVQRDAQGAFVVVGTNVKYAKFWELGFNRRLWVWFDEKKQEWRSRPGPTKYERVEKWRPTLETEAAQMIAKYAEFYGRIMERP